MLSKSQAPDATVQGEILLAKYLTDSIRSIEHAIRKGAPPGVYAGTVPRSMSAPRVDVRPDGRRAATEVLLPRKLPLSYAPAAAAAAAATRRDDPLGPAAPPLIGIGRPGANVTMTQARLLQGSHGGGGIAAAAGLAVNRSFNGAGTGPLPLSKVAAGGPPLPPRPAVVRTAAAMQQQQQQYQQQYSQLQPQSPVGVGGVRSSSAPRHHHHHHHHGQHHHHHHHHHRSDSANGYQSAPGVGAQASSEARVPAVAAAPPLASLLAPGGASGPGGGAGGPGGATRSTASMRRGVPSEAGTHSSWWRWRPVTDASFPMTAVTDRYADSMTPSELVKWNDRVARLEAEITAEKERRRQFEEKLKKLQANAPPAAAGVTVGGGTVKVATAAAGARAAGQGTFREA